MFKKASLCAGALLLFVLAIAGCGNPTTASNASPVTINTSSLPSGFVGTAYSATIAVTGGTAPYAFTLTSGSLPGGLVLNKAGLLSGTPTGSGTFSFTVGVTDSLGQSASGSFSLAMSVPLSISTKTLPNGTAYTAYSASVTAANGTAPYTYAITSGTQPTGLTLSSSGVLSGLPTTAGTFNFTVTATDSKSATATATYSVTIAAATAITLTPATLPAGLVGTAYSASVTAANGTAPYTYSVTSGTLPAGLQISTQGAISGTPKAAGTSAITITATDANGRTGSASYSIAVTATPTITITPATLPTGAAGQTYSSVTFIATGGTAPYTFSVPANTLPPGLTLSGSTLSGTPTTAGTYSFTVTATDAKSYTGTATYSVTIGTANSVITLTGNNLGALVNASYSQQLGLQGGSGTYTVTQTGGTLPGGITLSSTGLLSGQATTTVSDTFTIHVTDTSSPQLSADFTIALNVVNATVAVDTTKALATVPANFYGLHTAIYDPMMTDYTAIATAMQNTGVTTLRYPGGGLADVYHWAQNTMSPYALSAPATCNDGQVGYINQTDNFATFIKLLQASKAQAVITVNYGTSVADANASTATGYVSSTPVSYCSNPNQPGQPQEAAAWVAYANGSPSNTLSIGKDSAGFDWKTVGYWASLRAATPLATDDGYNFLRIGQTAPVGIKYWEVGNEDYYNGWSNNVNAETDTHAPYVYDNGYNSTYESRANVPALSPTSYGTNAIQYVNAMKAVDPTILVGLDYDLPGATDPIAVNYNQALTQSACSTGAFDYAIIHYYPGTYFGGAKPGELLYLPQQDLPADIVNGGSSYGYGTTLTAYSGIRQYFQQYCSNAANMQILMTETSPNNSLQANFPAPVIGLFVLNEMMESMSLGVQNFDWLELHANTSQTNYLDNTFLDSSENPGPSYYGFQLAHTMATPGDTQVSATANPAVTLSTGIVSYATLKANGQKGIVLINADPNNPLTTQVTVSGATLGSSATEYTYGINTTQTTQGPQSQLTGTSFAVPGQSFPVTVPPYTAVELIIQ